MLQFCAFWWHFLLILAQFVVIYALFRRQSLGVIFIDPYSHTVSLILYLALGPNGLLIKP